MAGGGREDVGLPVLLNKEEKKKEKRTQGQTKRGRENNPIYGRRSCTPETGKEAQIRSLRQRRYGRERGGAGEKGEGEGSRTTKNKAKEAF